VHDESYGNEHPRASRRARLGRGARATRRGGPRDTAPLLDCGETDGSFYRHLAPIANDRASLVRGDNPTFPLDHDELLERCRAAGQERPTPLILRRGWRQPSVTSTDP